MNPADGVRVLAWPHGRVEVQRLGAMLGPLRFEAEGHEPFEPLQVAPWADEPGAQALPGILRRLRTTPASPATLLAALFVVVAAVGLVVAALIVAVPAIAGAGLPEHLGWFALAAVLSLVAFLALGTLLAAVVPSPQVAAGLGNVVAALMWFSAGLWLPRVFFPDWLVTLTDLTPGGAATRAMIDAAVGVQPSWQPFVVLVVWTAAAALVAVRTFRWE